MQFPTDAIFTENLKRRVIKLVQKRDRGILGSFMVFQDDGDFDGFVQRIKRKVLSPPDGSSQLDGGQALSSATTAGFPGGYGGLPRTAMGQRRRTTTTHSESYIAIIIEL
jgi:hypothetical protein